MFSDIAVDEGMCAFWFLSDFWADFLGWPVGSNVDDDDAEEEAAAAAVATFEEDVRPFSKKAAAKAGSWNHSPFNSSKHQPWKNENKVWF